MSVIVVHPQDSRADARSLTQALRMAQGGDVVLVGPGVYAPNQTGETLPLRVPAGVAIEGTGSDECIFDGEGLFAPSFHPIRPDLSVVVLEEGTSLSGVTVTNGGGHGIGVPDGVTATVRNCTISRHGDHGVFLCGVAGATISNCLFVENGLQRFEPALPRGTGARQGHHIFAEARHGQQNRLLITDNTMRSCFADGIAYICFFPEADGVVFSATILRNTIEASERGGLLFSCSFGPAHNRLRIVAADNILRGNKQFGISFLTAVPLAEKVPQDSLLTALVAGNEIAASPVGVLVQGAAGEAHHNVCRVTIDRNRIVSCSRNAVRLVGAMGVDEAPTHDNTLHAEVSRNRITGSPPAVIVQGAGGAAKSDLRQNTVRTRLIDNLVDPPSAQTIVVSNGRVNNQAEVIEGSQDVTWTDRDLL